MRKEGKKKPDYPFHLVLSGKKKSILDVKYENDFDHTQSPVSIS